MMSSRNPRWLPVYKHWYIFYTIQSWKKYEKVNDHRCYIITKKFPQNVRELRMVAEEAFRGIILDKPLHCSGDLMQILETEASKSQTTKLWVDVLIKPVLLIMMFVRAEREGDWPLHLPSYKQMLPYFFAAGHVTYARYVLCYLRELERLPQEVLSCHSPFCWLMEWHLERHDE